MNLPFEFRVRPAQFSQLLLPGGATQEQQQAIRDAEEDMRDLENFLARLWSRAGSGGSPIDAGSGLDLAAWNLDGGHAVFGGGAWVNTATTPHEMWLCAVSSAYPLAQAYTPGSYPFPVGGYGTMYWPALIPLDGLHFQGNFDIFGGGPGAGGSMVMQILSATETARPAGLGSGFQGVAVALDTQYSGSDNAAVMWDQNSGTGTFSTGVSQFSQTINPGVTPVPVTFDVAVAGMVLTLKVNNLLVFTQDLTGLGGGLTPNVFVGIAGISGGGSGNQSCVVRSVNATSW